MFHIGQLMIAGAVGLKVHLTMRLKENQKTAEQINSQKSYFHLKFNKQIECINIYFFIFDILIYF